jgi:alpha-L-arabinofuranosidase
MKYCKPKQIVYSLFAFFLLFTIELSAQPRFVLDISKKGVEISPSHYGVFFEDINHAADGGIYAELIRNRSFEDAATPEYWSLLNIQSAVASISIESVNLLNENQSRALKLKVTNLPNQNSESRLSNPGFWGMNFQRGKTYKVSFFAKCDTVFDGELKVMLENEFHSQLASTILKGIGQEWQKFTCELVPDGNAKTGSFVMIANSKGTIWLDVVSVFPPTFKNRENGLRPDLAQLVDDMNPKFLRFPGGCFVEGDVLANRFNWKKTIGNIEDRPGHWNLWGYRTTDGLGYHEYLQLCEDVDAAPMFVANVGLAHNDFHPYNNLNAYIQDALDAIEYANGEVSTKYGAMRAAAGHPEPFNLKYLEVGNENFFGDHYSERYIQFYKAIKAKYPEVEIIGNVAAWGTDNPAWPFSHPVDLVDEHYYRNPQWFINQYNKYNSYDRSGPKIYVGEYAVTQDVGLGNLAAAVGEAVYMCGMEKNSDIVPLNSYAPMFVNVNDRKWNPDLINFNASEVYCTPSYYVQKMFASNLGTVNLLVKDSLNISKSGIKGAIGMGTWATVADYDNVKVVNSKGETLVEDNFSNNSGWSVYKGNWLVQSGVYSQSSTETDCRATNVSVSDTSYTYTLRARKKNGAEGFLIIFGYQNADNYYWWNLGGWGNTKHAVEQAIGGSKTVKTEVSGSIQSNVWYDIKIRVSTKMVYCYLNNQLIQSFEVPEERLLYTAATIDEKENMVYFKVVNPSGSDIESTFNLNGLNVSAVNGERITLTSFSKNDENSLEQPQRVFPVSESITDQPLEFIQTIPANSVNVFKFRSSDITGLKTIKKTPEIDFNIFPNPANDQLLVQYENLKRGKVQISNMTGVRQYDMEIENGGVIDISAIKPGVYLFCVEGLGTQKFIKR